MEAVDGLGRLGHLGCDAERVRLGHVPGDLEDAGAVAAALLQLVAEPADGTPVPALRIGDSFFWGTFRVIGAGVGAPMTVAGNVFGPIFYALLNVIPSEVVRRWGFKIGYAGGGKFLERVEPLTD